MTERELTRGPDDGERFEERRDLASGLEQISRNVARALVIIGALMVGAMVIHVAADITSRYILGRPLSGTVEIVARYYMVGVIFLPITWGYLRDEHFRVDLLDHLFSAGWVKFTDLLNTLVIAVLAGLLAWRLADQAGDATRFSEHVQTANMMIPTWPSRWIPVLGTAALCLACVLRLLAEGLRSFSPSVRQN